MEIFKKLKGFFVTVEQKKLHTLTRFLSYIELVYWNILKVKLRIFVKKLPMI